MKLRKSHCGINATNLQRVGSRVKSANSADGGCALMGQPQELVQKPKLAHELERRWMDGIAAEVAQEIGVLLQHDHIDPGACEQEAQHHPARAAAHNATPDG